jgi:hypothetical protein
MRRIERGARNEVSCVYASDGALWRKLEKDDADREERTEKHENWDKEYLFPIHNIVTNGKSFAIVETDDPLKLAKYRNDYGGVLEVEIHQIQEFSKLRGFFK